MIKGNFGIRKSDIINRRMFIIGTAKLVIFGGLIARLFSLQINDNKKFNSSYACFCFSNWMYGYS